MAAMGQNAVLVTVGGVPSYIELTHTWVSAYVPYTDYRGAAGASGDYVWLDLDTSIKEYENCASLYNIFTGNFTGFEAVDSYAEGGTAENLESEMISYAENIQEYFDNIENELENEAADGNKEAGMPEDKAMISVRNRAIKPCYETYLPLSLQYEVIEERDICDNVENQCDMVTLTIDYDDTLTFRSYELYNKRLTIEYEGAETEDREIISAYGSIFLTPAYLVYLVPVIKSDGEVIARGHEVNSGTIQNLSIHIDSGNMHAETVNTLTAGSMYSFVTDLQVITPEEVYALEDSLNNTRTRISDRWYNDGEESGCDEDDYETAGYDESLSYGFYCDEEMGVLLYTAGLKYFTELDANNMFLSEANNVYYTRYLSGAVTGYEVNVTERFGRVYSIDEGNLYIDVDFNNVSARSLSGDSTDEYSFMVQSGVISSGLESKIWADLLDVEAVSTVDILNMAKTDGTEVLCLTGENIDTYINSISISKKGLAEIRSSVSQGNIVFVPVEEVEIGAWKGNGYVAIDPETGTGSYMISTGQSGGITSDDVELSKAESDIYITAMGTCAAAIIAATLFVMATVPMTSISVVLSYMLLELEMSWSLLSVAYYDYRQDKLYEEYQNGDEASGYELMNNTLGLQIEAFSMAFGLLFDFIGILIDYDEMADEMAMQAAREATEQLTAEEAEFNAYMAAREAADMAAKEAAEAAVKEGAGYTENAVRDAAREAAGTAVRETFEQSGKEYAEETINDMAEEAAEYAAKEATGQTGQKAVKETAEEAVEAAARESRKEIAENVGEASKERIKKNLANEIEEIREKMPNSNLSKRGNMAAADVDIPGIKEDFIAHSKINEESDIGADTADFSFLKSENERIFTTYVDDKFPRYHDTEAKILEDIASQITDSNVEGTIYLYSELPCCQSCSNIILEFRNMFPNIKLIVIIE